jgi:hypothetical protein
MHTHKHEHTQVHKNLSMHTHKHEHTQVHKNLSMHTHKHEHTQVHKNLSMTFIGSVSLGSNELNSAATMNGIVAVAVAASDKTQPGTVFFLDAAAQLSVNGTVISQSGFVEGNVTVGAGPDMLTFTPDGKKVLVANEAEQDIAGMLCMYACVYALDICCKTLQVCWACMHACTRSIHTEICWVCMYAYAHLIYTARYIHIYIHK